MFAEKIRRPFLPPSAAKDLYDHQRYAPLVSQLAVKYLDEHPDFITVAISCDPALQELSPASARVQLESYPGVLAMAAHAEAHRWYQEGKALLDTDRPAGELKLNAARWLAEAAHAQTGMDIHPGTVIGENFFVDHASGDVIGETARIGNNTKMYHGVTLGALGKTPETGPRHPQIGDDCVLSMDVKVLGHVDVGNDVKIGPGSMLRGNNLTIGNHVRVRDNVLIEDGYTIEDGLTFGNGVTIARNPLAGKAPPIALTREKIAASLGMKPEELKEVPEHSFIQVAADGQRLECTRAGEKSWLRQVVSTAELQSQQRA